MVHHMAGVLLYYIARNLQYFFGSRAECLFFYFFQIAKGKKP